MDIKVSNRYGVNPSLDLCLFCGEPKGIALLGKLPNDAEAPRHIVTSDEPCDACKANMELGYTILEVTEGRVLTGRYVVITMEAAERLDMPKTLANKVLMPPKSFDWFTHQNDEG